MPEQDLTGWTIVFDLDGTLVDTAPDLHQALNHSLVDAGYDPVAFPVISSLIGMGAKAMIRRGLDVQGHTITDEALEPVWLSFLDYYRAHICELSTPYEMSVETVDQLQMAGAICAVCTNKTQALAEQLLSSLDLTRKFSAIVGADSVPARKPDGDHILRTVRAAGGDPERTIMIGDSQTDERAARDAGLPFIFVSFGYGPPCDCLEPFHVAVDAFHQIGEAVRTLASARLPQR